MKTIPDIRVPIWDGRKVGIASFRITEDVKFGISYKDSSGERLYPDTYIFRYKNKNNYPTQRVKGNVILVIVSIADLEIC